MKIIIIDEKTSGFKLFRFVKTILPQFKNNDIFKLIRKKSIKVNNSKTIQEYILKEGDEVKFFLDEKYFNQAKKYKYYSTKFHSVKEDFTVIFEDKNVVVVNKPVGVLIHPDKSEYKNTLTEMIKKYLYNKGEYDTKDSFAPSSCNRLDRNTSGLIIFAKNHKTLQYITKQFRERKVTKEYYAIVYGKVEKNVLLFSKLETDSNIVTSSKIQASFIIPDKKIFIKNHSDYSVTAIYPVKINADYSIVKVDLWTGKKHQIRIHLSKYKHPLLGDYKYFTYNSMKFTENNNIKHYYLHCYCINVPEYDKWISHPLWSIEEFSL